MKRLTWSMVLVLAVLGAGSAAQAAVVDVTLTFDKTTGITVGDTLNWELTILVSDNAADYTGVGLGVINLGVQAASIGLASDNPGIVEIEEGFSPFPPPGGPTGAPAAGTVNANVALEPTGFGAQSLPISPAYTGNRGLQPILLSGTITDGQEGWNGAFNDADPELKKGAGTAIVHMTGTMEALADGTVTYTPFIVDNAGSYNISVYTGDTTLFTWSQRSVNPGVHGDTLNLIGATLQVGGASTNPPGVTLDTPPIAEGDWAGPTGWNNPGRTVTIDATGTDNDGETQGLTWLWEVDDGTGFKTVGTAADQLVLSIQDLIDAGITLRNPTSPYNPADYEMDLRVTVTDPDGTASDTMKIFVPEPTTIGLLGFGVISALLRRRRRA